MGLKIISGVIKIERKTFARELLLVNSPMRKLIGLDDVKSKKVKNIVKSKEYVTVKYSTADEVYVDINFDVFFETVKEVYKGKIFGELRVFEDFIVDEINVTYYFD